MPNRKERWAHWEDTLDAVALPLGTGAAEERLEWNGASVWSGDDFYDWDAMGSEDCAPIRDTGARGPITAALPAADLEELRRRVFRPERPEPAARTISAASAAIEPLRERCRAPGQTTFDEGLVARMRSLMDEARPQEPPPTVILRPSRLVRRTAAPAPQSSALPSPVADAAEQPPMTVCLSGSRGTAGAPVRRSPGAWVNPAVARRRRRADP